MRNRTCCLVTKLCPALCDLMGWSMPGFSVFYYLLELAQTHVHWVGDVIQTSHTLLSPSPSAFNLSQHQALCFRWPKYWSFSFSISPSNEYSWLICFRMNRLDLLAVQGTLRSLLQYFKSINSSVLSLLYDPTLTSIHDYWKNHSFDYMNLCVANWCLCFLMHCLGLS